MIFEGTRGKVKGQRLKAKRMKNYLLPVPFALNLSP